MLQSSSSPSSSVTASCWQLRGPRPAHTQNSVRDLGRRFKRQAGSRDPVGELGNLPPVLFEDSVLDGRSRVPSRGRAVSPGTSPQSTSTSSTTTRAASTRRSAAPRPWRPGLPRHFTMWSGSRSSPTPTTPVDGAAQVQIPFLKRVRAGDHRSPTHLKANPRKGFDIDLTS